MNIQITKCNSVNRQLWIFSSCFSYTLKERGYKTAPCGTPVLKAFTLIYKSKSYDLFNVTRKIIFPIMDALWV